MNLKQLKYFEAIAEEHQVTAAAKRLNITQPPLSYELAQLERELGVTLVKRNARGVELTDAGQLLYERAEKILAMVSSAKYEVESVGKGFSGVLSLGLSPSARGIIPGERMLEFLKGYPNVGFEIHEGTAYEVIDLIERGIVDVGAMRTPFQAKSLACRYARPEPMVALVPPQFPCGGERGQVTLQDLASVPLVIYRRIELLVRGAFSDEGIVPYVSCLDDDAQTSCIWAKRGLGVALVPASTARDLDAGGLATKEVRSDRLVTRLAVVWDKNRYLSPLAQMFVELFEESEGKG